VVGLVTLLAMGVGVAVVSSMPNVYRASVVVRVEPARVSPELVQPTVTQLIEDRLKTVRFELFSRPILERVISDTNLYPKLREQRGVAAAVEEMRHHLDVKVEGENAFELTFEDSDPKVATTVANRLPALFAEETLKVRSDQAEAAQELFGDELDKLSKEVAEQEAKISQFKLQHLGELPEQMEANMRGLERLMALMAEKNESLRDAQRRQAEFSKNHFDADTEVGHLIRRQAELNQALDTAKSQWTEDHPEVQRLEREQVSIRSHLQETERQEQSADAERAVANKQVNEVQQEIATMQEQADMYRARLDNTPRWSAPLAALDRQYESLKAKYTQMLSKKVEADVAYDMELRARSQMFHVLSDAAEPVAPVRPDKTAGLALALLLAIGLGALVGIGLEMNDDSLRAAADARHSLHLPVLATVPRMGRLLGSGSSNGRGRASNGIRTLRPQTRSNQNS
jgi:polysaccharide chain length determinant protein (PEP-CTERM system associated)